jgi:hypothetical protein
MPQSDRVTEAIDTALSVFFTWQMLAAAFAIQFTMQALKRITNAATPRLQLSRVFKAFVASQNYFYGFVLAAPVGFLPGRTFFERAIMGIVAGGLSHLLYAFVLKKFPSLKGKSQPGDSNAND